jgi:hypothetical protein
MKHIDQRYVQSLREARLRRAEELRAELRGDWQSLAATLMILALATAIAITPWVVLP